MHFVAQKLIKFYHASTNRDKNMLKMKASTICSQSLLCFLKKLKTINGVKYRIRNIQSIPQMSVTKLKVMWSYDLPFHENKTQDKSYLDVTELLLPEGILAQTKAFQIYKGFSLHFSKFRSQLLLRAIVGPYLCKLQCRWTKFYNEPHLLIQNKPFITCIIRHSTTHDHICCECNPSFRPCDLCFQKNKSQYEVEHGINPSRSFGSVETWILPT